MDKDRLNLIPHQPGSYQYYNKDGIIIYVGKAKDLNNRVRSYFNGKVTGKTAKPEKERVTVQNYKTAILSNPVFLM